MASIRKEQTRSSSHTHYAATLQAHCASLRGRDVHPSALRHALHAFGTLLLSADPLKRTFIKYKVQNPVCKALTHLRRSAQMSQTHI